MLKAYHPSFSDHQNLQYYHASSNVNKCPVSIHKTDMVGIQAWVLQLLEVGGTRRQ